MRRSELHPSRYHCIGTRVISSGLQITFQYGKLEFDLYLTVDGRMDFHSWRRGEICSVPSAVQLVLWLKARELGILEKHGFL